MILDAIITAFLCTAAIKVAREIIQKYKIDRYNRKYKEFHDKYDKYRR